MSQYIPRHLAGIIKKQQSKFQILAVTGPRQSGKTTLLKDLFSDYRYVSLENPDIRTFATNDPVGFLKIYDNKVILDEVQRVPSLFSYLQTLVDESGKMGQYILSGSQNFQLLSSITQTLAGRVALFKLLPLDFGELKNNGLLKKKFSEMAIKGFYPAIYDRKINASVYYSNYLQTYIQRDVTELLHVKDLRQFRTFLKLCAGRAGQLVNFSALGNECDISSNTAKSWMSILESSYIIFLLQPYHQNFNKRLVKSPKLYFYDTGLLCHLLGIKSTKALEEDRLKGNLFENLIVAQFQKNNFHRYLDEDYFFWQDSNGNEVDLLLEKNRKFDVYEIKATETITPPLFKQLDNFEKNAKPAKVRKILIYAGTENQARTKYNVLAWDNISGIK